MVLGSSQPKPAASGSRGDDGTQIAVATTASSLSRLRLNPQREHTALVVFIVTLGVFFYAVQPLFGSAGNIRNLAAQAAVLGMVSAGQFFVVLGGGIDLSVAAQVGLLSILVVALSLTFPLGVAILLTILAGALIGLVNGLLVTFARISPIIATVAMLQVLGGVSLAWTGGSPQRNSSPNFTALGTQRIWTIPLSACLALAVFGISAFLLRRTAFGRWVYAIGGNVTAARLSGIDVRVVTIGTYVICSVLTALGAITLASRTGAGLPNLGSGLEILSITAVFIGGVAWGGGSGTALGAMLGVVLIAMVGNGLNLLAVGSNVQNIVTGVLMALAVALAATPQRRESRTGFLRFIDRASRSKGERHV